MKTIILLLLLLLTTGASTTLVAEESYVVVPVNLSLVPAVSLWASSGYKTINYLQINILAGYADVLRGAAVGTASIIGEDAVGLQTGVVNWVGRNLTGLQAGVVNTVLGTANGMQAGVLNITRNTNFAQVGVVNISKNARGVQFGVVNVAQENEGIPIGLLNVVLKNGQTHVQTWYDETGLINLALIHGTKTFYNIYTAGVDSQLEDVTAGIGLGVHIPFGRFFVNTEGIIGSVSSVDVLAMEWENFFRARAYLGFSISSFAFIGGASFNYRSNRNASGITLDPFHGYEFGFSSADHRFWPGFFIGIQL